MLLPGPPEPAPASGMGSAAGGAQCGEGEEWEGGWIATEAACTMASIGSSQDVLPGSLESNGPRVRAAHINRFQNTFPCRPAADCGWRVGRSPDGPASGFDSACAPCDVDGHIACWACMCCGASCGCDERSSASAACAAWSAGTHHGERVGVVGSRRTRTRVPRWSLPNEAPRVAARSEAVLAVLGGLAAGVRAAGGGAAAGATSSGAAAAAGAATAAF